MRNTVDQTLFNYFEHISFLIGAPVAYLHVYCNAILKHPSVHYTAFLVFLLVCEKSQHREESCSSLFAKLKQTIRINYEVFLFGQLRMKFVFFPPLRVDSRNIFTEAQRVRRKILK